MRFALVEGERQEAQPGHSGICPGCDRPMIAKCGEVNVWHWAHRGKCVGDPWWENESEWHRAWKGQFPARWQEIVHHAETGEKHIADVKTDRDWVIEFQHSPLNPEERRSRETFYRKLIWVVDGTRRKRDRSQLTNAWNDGMPVGANSPVRRIVSDDCSLLREWAGGNSPTFFDLGEPDTLWWLFARSANGSMYVGPFPRAVFVGSHSDGAREEAWRAFDDFVNTFPKQLAEFESLIAKQAVQGFQRYPVLRSRRRGRF